MNERCEQHGMNCFGEIRETKFIFVFARERGNTCVTNATGFAPLFLCFRLPRNYSHAGEKKDYLKVAAGRSPRERAFAQQHGQITLQEWGQEALRIGCNRHYCSLHNGP